MNVYDFDNTIYDGESSFDFFLFFLRKDPRVIRFIPRMIFAAVKYKLGLLVSRELYEIGDQMGKEFLSTDETMRELSEEFWRTHRRKIKRFYLRQRRPDDVIVSASPRFLLEPVCRQLGIRNLICSEFDSDTGKLSFACFRENKVPAFRRRFPHEKVDRFYTDSINDIGFMRIADRAYLVKGRRILKISSRLLHRLHRRSSRRGHHAR